MRALVVSPSNQRGAFAAVRRLHSAGWNVSAGVNDLNGLVSWSRATGSAYYIPTPEDGVDRFLDAVAAAVRSSGAEVVIPTDDADLLALSSGRERIPAVVPLASHEVVTRLVDKLELARAAAAAGLPTPSTRLADDGGLRETRYPVVVKARFHWQPHLAAGAPARVPARICGDRASASSYVEQMRQSGAEPLLQEVVEGKPVSVHLLSDRAGAVVSLTQQLSEPMYFPPGAGVRVRSVTTAVDPELERGLRRLIESSGWFGLAGVMFMLDAEGTPRLVDFNGRVPAALEASSGAGPNYVAAWAAMATGRPCPPVAPARVGTRYQWLEGDLRRALIERRRGLVRDVAGSLTFAFGATHTVLKRDEPLVAVRYAVRQVRESGRARRISREPS